MKTTTIFIPELQVWFHECVCEMFLKRFCEKVCRGELMSDSEKDFLLKCKNTIHQWEWDALCPQGYLLALYLRVTFKFADCPTIDLNEYKLIGDAIVELKKRGEWSRWKKMREICEAVGIVLEDDVALKIVSENIFHAA